MRRKGRGRGFVLVFKVKSLTSKRIQVTVVLWFLDAVALGTILVTQIQQTHPDEVRWH